jgi:NAD-dependent SIR2 family protein deacetylase
MHQRDCRCLECRKKSAEFFAGFDKPLRIPVCPTCGQVAPNLVPSPAPTGAEGRKEPSR